MTNQPEQVLKGERRRIIEQIRAEVRADWLRSEIEKLEGEVKENLKRNQEDYKNPMWNIREVGYRKSLTSIITRYKEELKVLEK